MAKGRTLLTIRVPEDLKARIERYSALQGVSINQFAMYVFAKELGELENSRYFANRLRNKTKQDLAAKFDAAMAKVKSRPVPAWDRLPRRKAK